MKIIWRKLYLNTTVRNQRRLLLTFSGRRKVVTCSSLPFLSTFPPELRLEIYRHVLVPDPNYFILSEYVSNGPKRHGHQLLDIYFKPAPSFHTRYPDRKRGSGRIPRIHTAILRTCKTVYYEAIDILYQGNMFGGLALACVDDRDNWFRIDSIKRIGISCSEFINQALAFPRHIREVTIFAVELDGYSRWKPLKGEDDDAWHSRVVEADPSLRGSCPGLLS